MKSPGLAVVLVVAALGAAIAMPLLAGSDTGSNQRRVLVISEARGYKHASIPDQVRFLKQLGRRSRRFDVIHVKQASDLTKEQLAGAKAVVFASTTGELPIDDETRQALVDFVKDGGALVGLSFRCQHLRSLAALPAPARGRLQEPPTRPTGTRGGNRPSPPVDPSAPARFPDPGRVLRVQALTAPASPRVLPSRPGEHQRGDP